MKEFGVCTDDGFDDSEYTYEEVAVEEDFESEGDVESEDLEATLRSLQKLSFLLGNNISSIAVLLSLNSSRLEIWHHVNRLGLKPYFDSLHFNSRERAEKD